jgi:hypothetical protein
MGATLLLHALLGASGASRLSQSRITSYFQPFEQGPLSADALQRLRGGATAGTCDVVLVGCGVPKRGMGWYHAKQMIEGDVPSAKLTTVCEPWFLGAGADSPPGKEFNAWADEMKSNHGIKFCASVADMEINVRRRPPPSAPRARGPGHGTRRARRARSHRKFFLRPRRDRPSRSSPAGRPTTRSCSRR